ncbi:uncharacterized protein LOC103521360 [Trichonephila clavipes]|nr:uncharacterized protein LOC103521360 [Trichonephila clavipes]
MARLEQWRLRLMEYFIAFVNFQPYASFLERMFRNFEKPLHEVRKKETDSKILRILSLEILDTLYPEDECLYVFTDGSKLTDNSNASTGVCCNLFFSFYTPIGIHSTPFGTEIAAIRIALSQLHCHTDRVSKVVILCDSRAALLVISSMEAPLSVDILKCQLLIGDLLHCHIDIAMQWIPSHCGIDGNETADCLTKKGTKNLSNI